MYIPFFCHCCQCHKSGKQRASYLYNTALRLKKPREQ
uniref:Uncharacterized protein n=1 Tax=Rhizophora mucronata TaxID=61149 RepID=A0A2P2LTJ5_RHIMU